MFYQILFFSFPRKWVFDKNFNFFNYTLNFCMIILETSWSIKCNFGENAFSDRTSKITSKHEIFVLKLRFEMYIKCFRFRLCNLSEQWPMFDVVAHRVLEKFFFLYLAEVTYWKISHFDIMFSHSKKEFLVFIDFMI